VLAGSLREEHSTIMTFEPASVIAWMVNCTQSFTGGGAQQVQGWNRKQSGSASNCSKLVQSLLARLAPAIDEKDTKYVAVSGIKVLGQPEMWGWEWRKTKQVPGC
jgi:hypothetical protein